MPFFRTGLRSPVFATSNSRQRLTERANCLSSGVKTTPSRDRVKMDTLEIVALLLRLRVNIQYLAVCLGAILAWKER